ncbi:MAG TPA: alpha/beta hydrolase [Oligoflexia bacterium]|nr:alpha/beta hydrolase [Oligoflexia bacterium]HMR25310.1 alpha/beta hydrolase [Oligoflexia bacterium]
MRYLIFYILILLSLTACFPYQNLIHESSASAKKSPLNQFKHLKFKNRDLSYVYSNPDQHKNILVFVHGSPGSWKSFSYYLNSKKLKENFGLLVFDRPGYGTFIDQGSEKLLGSQAQMLNAILKKEFNLNHSITLIGHSYGGPLIAKMAIELADTLNINTLYFLAASMDPDLEKTKWFQYPAQWKIFKWLIPKPLVHCNEEILHLKQDLLKLKPQLKLLAKKNILVLHGNKDDLVPVENISYMQKHMHISNENITILNKANHFIPWSQSNLIIENLLNLIDKKNI